MLRESLNRTNNWVRTEFTIRKGAAIALAVAVLTGGVVSERSGLVNETARSMVGTAVLVGQAAGFVGDTTGKVLYEVRKFTSDRSREFSDWTNPDAQPTGTPVPPRRPDSLNRI